MKKKSNKSMGKKYDTYQSPLADRYASEEMSYNFSDQLKYSTWRKLWIALAETEKSLGVKAISRKQIDEMKKFQDNINFEAARKHELRVKHDVMAHVHALVISVPPQVQ